MAITIDRDQRDATYQQAVLDLYGLTDLWTEFSDGGPTVSARPSATIRTPSASG